MERWLLSFFQSVSNNLPLLFVGTFLGGLVSAFSPCVLTAMPLIIGGVGGYAGSDRQKALAFSAIFCLGLVVTFTTLGALAASMGRLLSGVGSLGYGILGLIMILTGLNLLEILKFASFTCRLPKVRAGLWAAFILGILAGLLSSPCSTPILIAVLAMVAGKSSLVLGVSLLAVYALAHCVLLLIAGASVGLAQELASSPRTERWGKALRTILGALITVLGIYMLYQAL